MSDSTIHGSRRPLGTSTTSTTSTNPVEVRRRLTSPAYTPADLAVANEVRARLDAGTYDRNPALKARVVSLLASVDASSSGQPARVPDRATITRTMDELNRIRSGDRRGAGSTADTGTVTGTTPPPGTEQPFDVNPVGNTAPPERIREVKVAWDYDCASDNIAGFRLYHEGVKVGEIRSAAARSMNVDVSLSEGAHSFTLTAFDVNGVESAHSAPAILNNVFPQQ
jgi:hypothetical protein